MLLSDSTENKESRIPTYSTATAVFYASAETPKHIDRTWTKQFLIHYGRLHRH